MLNYDLQFFGGRGASGTLKNPNGKVVSRQSNNSTFQLRGETHFGLVEKDGQKASVYVAVIDKDNNPITGKVDAYIYNIDGRDIAIHREYNPDTKDKSKLPWVTTDVATGARLPYLETFGAKKQILDNPELKDVVSKIKKIDFTKYSPKALDRIADVQKKLLESKKKRK